MHGLRRCGIYTQWNKKEKIMLFAATWMELETHTKGSESERGRQIPHDVTYIWNLIYGTNESIYQIDSQI